jgi:hypothetical protein
MSDLLADRFLAIADLADDGDWREVRGLAGRRARRRGAVLLAAAAAAVVTAVAVAATSGWVFRRAPNAEPSFARTFAFHGARWSLTGYLTGNGELSCFRLGPAGTAKPPGTTCLEAPLGWRSPTGTTVGFDHRGGQIWFGDARASVARVVITDSRGRTFSAPAVTTPTLPYPTARFRLWLIALPSSTAATIAAYDRRGKLLYEGPAGLRWAPARPRIH